MHRSRVSRPLTWFGLLLLAALAVTWVSAHPTGTGRTWTPVDPAPSHEAASGSILAAGRARARVPVASVLGGGEPRSSRPSSIERSGLGVVAVHGRIVRKGQAVPDFLVRLWPLTGDVHDEDEWEVTDEEGRFTLLLPPACYCVTDEDEASLLRSVCIEADADSLAFEIELP